MVWRWHQIWPRLLLLVENDAVYAAEYYAEKYDVVDADESADENVHENLLDDVDIVDVVKNDRDEDTRHDQQLLVLSKEIKNDAVYAAEYYVEK